MPISNPNEDIILTTNTRPVFRAGKNTAQNVPNATATVVQFQKVAQDTLNNFVGGTGQFTATVAGSYQFNTSLRFDFAIAAVNEATIEFQVNGVRVARAGFALCGTLGGTLTYYYASLASVLELAVNDVVTVVVTQNTGLPQNLNSNNTINTFNGYYIHSTY